MERRTVTRWGGIALLVVGAIVVAGYGFRHRGHVVRAIPVLARHIDASAPEGVRIRVQVLNATRVQGLARRATLHLRDRGFDVVESGNAGEVRDSTLVLDRSGHSDWAQRVADALGGAPVVVRRDSSRYLDVTVLVGASWRPPAEPFYP